MPRFPAVASTSAELSDRVFSRLAEKAKARGGKVHALHVGDTWLEPLAAGRAEAQRTEEETKA